MVPVLAPGAWRQEEEIKMLQHLLPHPTWHSQIAAAHQYVAAELNVQKALVEGLKQVTLVVSSG